MTGNRLDEGNTMADGPAPLILVERDGPVLVIRFNRPEVMNAVDAPTAVLVGDALEEAEQDPEVRAVVVTGAGSRAFCAGADLKAAAAGRPVTPEERRKWGFAGYVSHYISKPTIAAVNGIALGGGAEVVLASDLAIAGRSASFGFTEIRWGLMASAGGTIRLPHHLPRKLAMELLLTGERIDAEQALRWGLVNRVVDDDEVLAESLRLAKRVGAFSPLAIATTKRLAYGRYGEDVDPEGEAWKASIAAHRALLASDDGKEGPRAFAEGREPHWKGT